MSSGFLKIEHTGNEFDTQVKKNGLKMKLRQIELLRENARKFVRTKISLNKVGLCLNGCTSDQIFKPL